MSGSVEKENNNKILAKSDSGFSEKAAESPPTLGVTSPAASCPPPIFDDDDTEDPGPAVKEMSNKEAHVLFEKRLAGGQECSEEQYLTDLTQQFVPRAPPPLSAESNDSDSYDSDTSGSGITERIVVKIEKWYHSVLYHFSFMYNIRLVSAYMVEVVRCFIEPLFVILQMGSSYAKGVEGVARTHGPAPVLTRRDGAQLTRQRTAST